MPRPLDGRVALVTGANHGIGAATARRLAVLGADVVATYLRGTNPVSGDGPDGYTALRAQDAAALFIAELARRIARRRARWGRIVGLTSGGPDGFPNEVSYGAAKAAQENYTLSAATELAPLGITANIVHPPVTDTGWVNDAVRDFVASSPRHTHIASAEDVAVVIGWLCTDDARLVSGTVMRLR